MESRIEITSPGISVSHRVAAGTAGSAGHGLPLPISAGDLQAGGPLLPPSEAPQAGDGSQAIGN